jgi:uncharacterized protein YndB with AHSA1/START domain
MERNLTLKHILPYSPEKVWQVLTDKDDMAKWLAMANDFVARKGHRAQFTSPTPQKAWDGIVHSEVLEVDVNRRIAYTWEFGEQKVTTTLVWTLKAKQNGTEVTLEHKGFTGVGGFVTSMAFASTWKNVLKKKLPAVLKYVEEHQQELLS